MNQSQELVFMSQWLNTHNIPFVGSIIKIAIDDLKEIDKLIYIKGKKAFMKAMEYMVITQRYELANQMKLALDREREWVDNIIKGL